MSSAHRRWVSVALVAGLAALAGMPVASAQGGPQFTLEPKIETPRPISCDLCDTTVYVNVTIRATNSQSPFNSQFDVYVTLGVNHTQQEGWGVGTISPDKTVKGRPGDTIPFSLVVSNTNSEPKGSELKLTFDFRSRPQYNGPRELDPVSRTLVERAGQESTAPNQNVVVKRDLTLAQSITGFARAQPWLLVAGAGVLIVAGVVLVRRKKGGVVVSTEAAVQEVLPGRGASFPVRLQNEGGAKQTITLGTSDVPAGWSAILPLERVELGPNESTTIWLTIKSPNEAAPGQHLQMNFIATTGDGVTSELLLEATVVERYGHVPPGQQPAEEPPAQPVASPPPTHASAPTPAPRRARSTR